MKSDHSSRVVSSRVLSYAKNQNTVSKNKRTSKLHVHQESWHMPGFCHHQGYPIPSADEVVLGIEQPPEQPLARFGIEPPLMHPSVALRNRAGGCASGCAPPGPRNVHLKSEFPMLFLRSFVRVLLNLVLSSSSFSRPIWPTHDDFLVNG